MSQTGADPKKITIRDLKKALWKSEFRNLFPELKEQIKTFLQNPNCKCNAPLYNTILHHRDRLESFFGTPLEIVDKPVTEQELLSRIHVINTTVDNLEAELRKLPVGPKHITVSRYQNDITAVVQLLS